LKEHTTKDGKKYLFMWNGFSVSLPVDEKDFEMQNRFNTIPEEIRMVDMVLQKRVSIMKYLDIQ
ncbi:MAG: hypothetical protein RMJ67_08735, partial [Elusimicrobiota bacterium]|nr:hypothetical protein [Endomicrobiia bacterium]MDW8166581.1 hypothetical protein [Elusimicrobiota bacterium]